MDAKPDLKYWLIGLAMFGVLIAMGVWLRGQVPFSVIDHQEAATALRVDEIQGVWRDAGLSTFVLTSMVGDLIFIGFYGYGAVRAGRSFLAMESGLLRLLGATILLGGIAFLITDYLETLLQIVQMVRDTGSDRMAATAAFAQPIKTVSWILTFFGVIVALVVRRFV